jgi:hypothetical protein
MRVKQADSTSTTKARPHACRISRLNFFEAQIGATADYFQHGVIDLTYLIANSWRQAMM